MSGASAMGLHPSRQRSSVDDVNLKFDSSGLAPGSMPGRCSRSVRFTANITPLPKFVSSVSYFSRGGPIRTLSNSPVWTAPPRRTPVGLESAFEGSQWPS